MQVCTVMLLIAVHFTHFPHLLFMIHLTHLLRCVIRRGLQRDPTKQCASAWAADNATTKHASANAREQLEKRSMTILHLAREQQNGRLRPPAFTTPTEDLASAER